METTSLTGSAPALQGFVDLVNLFVCCSEVFTRENPVSDGCRDARLRSLGACKVTALF